MDSGFRREVDEATHRLKCHSGSIESLKGYSPGVVKNVCMSICLKYMHSGSYKMDSYAWENTRHYSDRVTAKEFSYLEQAVMNHVDLRLDPFCYPNDDLFSKVEKWEAKLLEQNDRELYEPIAEGSAKPHDTVFLRRSDKSWYIAKVLEIKEQSSNHKNWKLIIAIDRKGMNKMQKTKKRKFSEYSTKEVSFYKENTWRGVLLAEGEPYYKTISGVRIYNPNKVLRRRTNDSAPISSSITYSPISDDEC